MVRKTVGSFAVGLAFVLAAMTTAGTSHTNPEAGFPWLAVVGIVLLVAVASGVWAWWDMRKKGRQGQGR